MGLQGHKPGARSGGCQRQQDPSGAIQHKGVSTPLPEHLAIAGPQGVAVGSISDIDHSLADLPGHSRFERGRRREAMAPEQRSALLLVATWLAACRRNLADCTA